MWLGKLGLGALAAGFCVTLLSCNSKSKKDEICQEADWYEIGRREGANGRPLQIDARIAPRCPTTEPGLVEALFRNGHYRGTLEFCTPENGFEMGKTGQSYLKVCPESLESSFVKRYQAGLRFFAIEQENRQIDEKMETIFTRLNRQNLDIATQSTLRAELDTLQKNRAQNDRRLDQLEKTL